MLFPSRDVSGDQWNMVGDISKGTVSAKYYTALRHLFSILTHLLSENPEAWSFQRLEIDGVRFIYCRKQLFSSLNIFGLEALEATLGDGDVCDKGVQLVHL